MTSTDCMMKGKQRKTGTQELADVNVNFFDGCIYNCRYCYAWYFADRFGRMEGREWKQMQVKPIPQRIPRNGMVMLSSTHDFFPGKYLDFELENIREVLEAGNSVVLATKAHPAAIKAFCEEFPAFKEKIEILVDITTRNRDVQRFWEPGAPSFVKRFEALKMAFEAGFTTSVIIEPFLDFNPVPLVMEVEPFVRGVIWLGALSFIPWKHKPAHGAFHFEAVKEARNPAHFREIHDVLVQVTGKIRFKDTFMRIMDRTYSASPYGDQNDYNARYKRNNKHQRSLETRVDG